MNVPFAGRMARLRSLLRAATAAAVWSLCIGLAAGASFAGDEAAVGFVKTVSGAAEIVRADLNWPMKAGAAIYEGDVLSSGPDGTFGITFKDDTRISGGPNTRLEVKAFRYEPVAGEFSWIIDMVKGSLLYVSGTIAKLAPDAAKVETPRGTIAVRGTRFLVRIGE